MGNLRQNYTDEEWEKLNKKSFPVDRFHNLFIPSSDIEEIEEQWKLLTKAIKILLAAGAITEDQLETSLQAAKNL